MKLDINYPQKAAEFVFVGVAVALAVLSWREGLMDRRIEAEYIHALKVDLELGIRQQEVLTS